MRQINFVKLHSVFAVLGTWLLSTTFCRADQLPEIDAQPHFPASRLKRLPEIEQKFIEAYRKVGSHDARWNSSAETALLLYSRFLCFEQVISGTTNFQVMAGALKKALANGCDDPLVAYAALRLRQREVVLDKRSPFEVCRAFLPALKAHPYPANLQAEMYARGAMAAMNDPAQKAQAKAWVDLGVAKLAEAIAQGLDREDLYEVAPQLFYAGNGAYTDRKTAFDLLQAQLAKRAAVSNHVSQVIAASFYLDWAGDADRKRQGLPSTNSVAQENASLFIERVEHAEEFLERAWEQDYTDSFLCKQMLNALCLQVNVADKFELWFERGVQANPANYGLYATKLRFLQSRWSGSKQSPLGFARECVQQANWREQIPFILVDAHQRNSSPENYQKPDVWADIQKVHETYLKLFPANNVVRSSYAHFACLAQHWDLARTLLDQMGDLVVPGMFRGDYEKSLAAIKQHASKR